MSVLLPVFAPTPLTPREAAALDADGALGASTQWQLRPDGTREAETRLLLDGLHCAACAGIIEAAVGRVEGVLGAEVNAAAARARVRWDPQRTRASALVDAVQRAGYRAYPVGADDALRQQQAAQRTLLWRLFVAAFCMMQVMMAAAPSYFARPGEIAPDLLHLLGWTQWVLSLPVLLFSARPFFGGAWQALRRRRLGMDVPVALGIAITFVASSAAVFDPQGPFGAEPYFDSLTMFVSFLLVGRWLEARARARSTRALDALLRRLPDVAERVAEDGQVETVAVTSLKVGDRVRVAVGQALPGDGVLVEGASAVDEALLSGESEPRPRVVGDALVAGSVNVSAPLVMRLTQVGAGTRHQQIVDLVQRALTERPETLRLADRVAGPFLLVVLLLAVTAYAVWSVFEPARAVWVAVSVLIVTCPCALSLAAPSTLIAAAGALARRGVLLQRFDALEALATVDLACFDKTGTLTEERPQLAQVAGAMPGPAREVLASRAAALAAYSHHPLAVALAQALPRDTSSWRDVHEQPGLGLQACAADGRSWRLGSSAWVGVPETVAPSRPTVWFGPVGGAEEDAVRFEFDETVRADAPTLLAALREQGIDVRLLSGDRAGPVARLAEQLRIDQVLPEASPEAKLDTLRQLQRDGHRVLMVGDGLNDGPVLAQADVSVALGHGAALAQQRADLVVLGSRLGEVAAAHRLARRCRRIVRQNLAWALAYNALAVPLALAGGLPPWAAGLGMALSSLFVVGNALRLSR